MRDTFGKIEKKVWNFQDLFNSDVNTKLVDIKNRLEKEFKNAESFLEKIIVTKICIFVDCLLKCYSPERQIFLRSDLLPSLKKEKIIKKMRKYLQRISECSSRKRSDSTWKKFGKSTIERSKESNDTGKCAIHKMNSKYHTWIN